MTPQQVAEAAQWLGLHKQSITRIRPHIAGSIVWYFPRRGWGTGLDGHVDAPAMWASRDEPDPMDAVFRSLDIPVDQPLC